MAWRRRRGDPHGGRRSAAVYRRGQTYVVTSERRFGYFPSYRSPPYLLVSRSATDAELGAAVIRAIESFQYMESEPSETEIDAANSELYAMVGVKDGATFERGASLVDAVEHRGRWVIQAWARRRGAWYPLNEDTCLHLTAPTTEQIGAAVRKAFVVLSGSP